MGELFPHTPFFDLIGGTFPPHPLFDGGVDLGLWGLMRLWGFIGFIGFDILFLKVFLIYFF